MGRACRRLRRRAAALSKPPRARQSKVRFTRTPDGGAHVELTDSFQRAVGPADLTAGDEVLFAEIDRLRADNRKLSVTKAANEIKDRIPSRSAGTQPAAVKKFVERYRARRGLARRRDPRS